MQTAVCSWHGVLGLAGSHSQPQAGSGAELPANNPISRLSVFLVLFFMYVVCMWPSKTNPFQVLCHTYKLLSGESDGWVARGVACLVACLTFGLLPPVSPALPA